MEHIIAVTIQRRVLSRDIQSADAEGNFSRLKICCRQLESTICGKRARLIRGYFPRNCRDQLTSALSFPGREDTVESKKTDREKRVCRFDSTIINFPEGQSEKNASIIKTKLK